MIKANYLSSSTSPCIEVHHIANVELAHLLGVWSESLRVRESLYGLEVEVSAVERMF